MRKKPRTARLLFAMLAAVVFTGMMVTSASGASRDDQLAATAPTPALHWKDCSDGFQCASAPVPLDYHAPKGRAINLAVIRLPATDQAHRIGSLFVNFGGPGSDGLSHLRGRARWDWLFSPALRQRFDLVSWDPRGIGHSAPVNCFAGAAERDSFLGAIPEFPVGPSEQGAFYRTARDYAGRCAARNAELLRHVSTANTARDLDLLRRAVGDSKLSYHGISYGTQLGATYANMFPDKVRALVLDGSLDFAGNSTGHGIEGLTTPLDTRQRVPEGLADTFSDFLAQCAAPGALCDFAGGDLAAKFAMLTTAAKRTPLVAGGQRYTYADIIGYVNGDLAIPDRWQEMATTLQQLYLAATSHTVSARAATSAPYTDNLTDSFYAIQCADSNVPRLSALYTAAALRAERRIPYWGDIGVYDMTSCAYWQARDTDRYIGPWNRSTAPILMINSRHDPSTPLPGAQDGQHELNNAHMLVVNGSGHSTMLVRSHCAEAAGRAYLVDGTLPANGATCGIDDTPFDNIPPPPD